MEHLLNAYNTLADAGPHSLAMSAERAGTAMASGVANFAQSLAIEHDLDVGTAAQATARDASRSHSI